MLRRSSGYAIPGAVMLLDETYVVGMRNRPPGSAEDVEDKRSVHGRSSLLDEPALVPEQASSGLRNWKNVSQLPRRKQIDSERRA